MSQKNTRNFKNFQVLYDIFFSGGTTPSHLFPNLESLSLKGVVFSTPDVLYELLLETRGLSRFTFFQKLERPQANREPSQEPLNDAKLARLVGKNVLSRLEVFHVTAIDHEFGPVLIGERALFLLAAACPRLAKVGNLSKWLLEDLEATLEKLDDLYSWIRI